jgi:hypothetical protein
MEVFIYLHDLSKSSRMQWFPGRLFAVRLRRWRHYAEVYGHTFPISTWLFERNIN